MNDSVQQIKEKLNIIDIISPYTELHKAGRHFVARCPFHNEKTPSFNVSPERGMYHCYGCGVGGDIFTFVQEMEGVDFKESLRILAEKAGIELKPVSPQKKTERERAYGVLEEVTAFYENKLTLNSEPMDYLRNRGVSEKTIAIWRLGFAPGPPTGGWRETKEFLLNKNYTESELKKTGLIKGGEDGKEPYDVFRNRVMFPIFDQAGRPVAFSGRTLEQGDKIPKYVNSPETELFKKSEILYGYHKAKHGIRQLGFSLIVEGQFDVVMSHQAGYSNTVAVSGTALTLEHVHLLERLSNKVVLALDADQAGVKAVKKAAELMLSRGLDVKVAVVPESKDPADLILNDPKEFKKIIGKSLPVIEFLLLVLEKENLPERTFKLRAREEIVPYVLHLPNRIDQDYFENKLAEKLKTTKDAIHYEVERFRELSDHASGSVALPSLSDTKKITTKNNDKDEVASRYLTLLTYILGVLPILEEKVAKKLEQKIETITGEELSKIEDKISKPALAEVTFRFESSLDELPRRLIESEVLHAFNQLREVVIRKELKEVREKMYEAERLGELDIVANCVKRVGELQKIRQEPPFDESLLH